MNVNVSIFMVAEGRGDNLETSFNTEVIIYGSRELFHPLVSLFVPRLTHASYIPRLTHQSINLPEEPVIFPLPNISMGKVSFIKFYSDFKNTYILFPTWR